MKTKNAANNNVSFTGHVPGLLKQTQIQKMPLRNNLAFVAAFILLMLLSGNLLAQKAKESQKIDTTRSGKIIRNAINVCPGGIAFGIFSINYERLLKPKHGLVARLDYEAIPKTYSDANIEADGKAFVLNYRYHIGGGLESFYAGAYARYRVCKGTGTQEGVVFNFSIPETTFGLNVGKRWIWKSGFTLNLALGYGISFDKTNIYPDNSYTEASVNVFKNQYSFLGPSLGEFSIGYAF
jgi:hypothetical protein